MRGGLGALCPAGSGGTFQQPSLPTCGEERAAQALQARRGQRQRAWSTEVPWGAEARPLRCPHEGPGRPAGARWAAVGPALCWLTRSSFSGSVQASVLLELEGSQSV